MATTAGSNANDSGNTTITTTGNETSVSLPPKESSATTSDTCSCHPDGTPRTCYECLNVQLLSGEECMINPFGQCVSLSTGENEKLFLASLPPNFPITPHDDVFYSSSNDTYCSFVDSTCSSAWDDWLSAYASNAFGNGTVFSRTGVAGCICTAYCEFRQHNLYKSVIGSQLELTHIACSKQDPTTQQPSSGAKSYDSALLAINIIGLFVVLILVVLTVRWGTNHFKRERARQRLQERRRMERNQATASHFAPILELEGWNRYREQLIESEQVQLGLAASRGSSDAPTREAPQIQVGEGFRPISPSQMRQTVR